ncbi:MAG: hypothetical protein ABI783_07640, partial [Actinomycetota bacterium]
MVAISEKIVQPAPWQRSIRYWATPTLSVAGPQERSIWLEESAVALRVPGGPGGVVSGDGRPIVRAPKSSARPVVPRM